MPKAFKGSNARVVVAVPADHSDHPTFLAAVELCRRSDMNMRIVTYGEPSRESLAKDVVDRIIVESTLSKASLILVGDRHLALRLMAESPAPVMIVTDSCTVDLAARRLVMMLADDLTPDCERATLVAYDLAIGLSSVDLHHVHVAPPGQSDDKALLSVLSSRATERGYFLEPADCRYKPVVLRGSPKHELERYMEATHPDLAVFGRHRLFHISPLGIGHLPTSFLLHQTCALISTPP